MSGQDRWEKMVMAFGAAMYDLPECPPVQVLTLLKNGAYAFSNDPAIVEEGLRLQQKFGLDAVPPKAEYEWAAGLWSIMRAALLEHRKP